MDPLLKTIVVRPYVFVFLIAFLSLSIYKWGWKKSLLWLITGYGIAWLSEFSSIHTGFPYGSYKYVYENLSGELLVAGVPFFDSLSYPFLIFAGYTTAQFVTRYSSSVTRQIVSNNRLEANNVFLGALFTMLLDVIIDPIATMGDKWFLGKIHYYEYPGRYFGVPITNFAGWFLVSATVILFNVLIWQLIESREEKREARYELRVTSHKSRFLWLYPTFYASIAFFNIIVTFYVGEWKLGIISSAILLAILTLIKRGSLSETVHQKK